MQRARKLIDLAYPPAASSSHRERDRTKYITIHVTSGTFLVSPLVHRKCSCGSPPPPDKSCTVQFPQPHRRTNQRLDLSWRTQTECWTGRRSVCEAGPLDFIAGNHCPPNCPLHKSIYCFACIDLLTGTMQKQQYKRLTQKLLTFIFSISTTPKMVKHSENGTSLP